MFSALLHLTMTLSHTLGEMNNNNLNPVSVNLQAINRRILEKNAGRDRVRAPGRRAGGVRAAQERTRG